MRLVSFAPNGSRGIPASMALGYSHLTPPRIRANLADTSVSSCGRSVFFDWKCAICLVRCCISGWQDLRANRWSRSRTPRLLSSEALTEPAPGTVEPRFELNPAEIFVRSLIPASMPHDRPADSSGPRPSFAPGFGPRCSCRRPDAQPGNLFMPSRSGRGDARTRAPIPFSSPPHRHALCPFSSGALPTPGLHPRQTSTQPAPAPPWAAPPTGHRRADPQLPGSRRRAGVIPRTTTEGHLSAAPRLDAHSFRPHRGFGGPAP